MASLSMPPLEFHARISTVHGLKVQLGWSAAWHCIFFFFFSAEFMFCLVLTTFAVHSSLRKRSEGIAGAQAAYQVSPGGG